VHTSVEVLANRKSGLIEVPPHYTIGPDGEPAVGSRRKAKPHKVPSKDVLLQKPESLRDGIYLRLIGLLILVGCLGRFVALGGNPPGFYRDEAASAMNVICISQSGADASGNQFPLFSEALGGGFSTPAYLYFGAVWARIFGTSIYSFRSMAAFFNVLTIVALFLCARLLLGPKAALLTALTAVLSPWSFQLSRVNWDPPLAPCFLVWGVYFFMRSNRVYDAASAAALFALSMYSYPPLRVQVPLLLAPLLWLKWKHSGLRRSVMATCGTVGVIVAMPLLIGTLSGELQTRYEALSIFSKHYLRQFGDSSPFLIPKIFLQNLLVHFSPNYLFFSGDANWRHSSQFTGQLSWVDDFALLLGIALLLALWLQPSQRRAVRPGLFSRSVLLFSFLGVLAGTVPPALTWEGLPHALRSIGVWPFACLATGQILWRTSERWRFVLPIIVGLSSVYICLYTRDYFTRYRAEAGLWFDSPVAEAAQKARATGNWSEFGRLTQNYPEKATRYFLVAFGDETCTSSLERLKALRKQ
jgi:4-amino-4-deoxy-L-arabinose transferase-like glycosyltransferase